MNIFDLSARAVHLPWETHRQPGATHRTSVSGTVQRVLFALAAGLLLAGCASKPEQPKDPVEATFPQIERWWK